MVTYRVPLPSGHVGHLNEKPLAGDVFEAGLDNTQFHSAARVDQNFGEAGGTASTDLPVYTFPEVNDAWPDGEPPALVAEAVLSAVERERLDVVWPSAVANEAPSRMGVKTNHEEKREVVGVPERFEALVANFVVRSCIHEDHNEQHEVTGDTTGLGVVDVQGRLRANLCA